MPDDTKATVLRAWEMGTGASGTRGAPGATPPPFMRGQGMVVPVTPPR
jgi:hypothetical protein